MLAQRMVGRGRFRALLVLAAAAVCLVAVSSASAAVPPPRCSAGLSPPPSGTPLYTTQTAPWNPMLPTELVPDQWLAKLYTEVLGCAPDQASYGALEQFIRTRGCGVDTLRAVALAFLTSREFLHDRSYDNAQRLLILWRVARESEPDAAQYYPLLAALDSGRVRWDAVALSFFQPPGFTAEAPRLCSAQLYGWNADAPVIDIATPYRSGAFAGGSGERLQSLLDRTKPGHTVWLARSAVVRLDQELIIPPGVRLQTVGSPTPSDYAAMARLIRTKIDGRPLVTVSVGATLANVWVDGQRSNQAIGIDHDSINLHVLGGEEPTTIREDRIDNTAGWTNMLVEPGPAHVSARLVSITGNLIDGYSTKFHYYETAATNNIKTNQFGFADGVSNSYGNSWISGNQFVDVTDVSVVNFKDVGSPSHQRSVVEHNTIVNAGNSGWAAFTVDPLYPTAAGPFDFAGTTIEHNLIWTSPNAFLLVIAGIGTKPWFGDSAYGYGRVRFTGNTTGGVRINTQMAIAVSRMSGAVVHGNRLLARLASADACPTAYIGIDQSAGSIVRPAPTPVTFQWFPVIPSVSQGCLVIHQ
jgi:hypothetical protein